MEWILIIGAVFAAFYFFTRNRERSTPPLNTRPISPPEPQYEDYVDEIERKPIENLVGDEIEIRLAADLFEERRDARDRAYRDHKAALKEAEKKLKKAMDFVEASRLGVAVPFLVDETRHWPSWSKHEGWEAPLPVSDIAGTKGSEQPHWVQFRVNDGNLFKVEAKRSSMPAEDDDEYGTIRVFVGDELMLEAGALRNWISEWARWRIVSVDTLKVGPWVSEFVGVYCDLIEQQENERRKDEAEFVKERASRIDFGEKRD